jgi:hypothetical protein
MQHGGRFGLARIPWFNGGLFDNANCLPLEKINLDTLHSAATRASSCSRRPSG